jgi:hypothetical protein
LPVALDTGAGLPRASQTSLWSPGPRRAGVATGVSGLHGFRIDVPAGKRLCASRLSVGVFRAAAG